MTPPFVAALGDRFDTLPPTIRALHGARGRRLWRGRVTVTAGPLLGLAGRLGLLPAPMEDAPFSIEIRPEDGAEIWTRHFDGRAARSRVAFRDGALRERAGPVSFALDPAPVASGLAIDARRARLFGLPIRDAISPGGRVALSEAEGRYRFDVAALSPSGGVSLRYAGWLAPA